METIRGGRRREVLELFRARRRPLSAREIAEHLGLHVNTVRFHLDTLLRHGVLRREERERHRDISDVSGRGRPATRYVLAPGMDSGGPRNYKLLAEMLLSHLAGDPDPVASATGVGASWGSYLVLPPTPAQHLSSDDAVTRVTGMLADIGFEPQARPAPGDDVEVVLHHCPFLELAAVHRDLICALHLGLMHGALERLGTPLRTRSLTPFADPNTCVSRLGLTEAVGVDR